MVVWDVVPPACAVSIMSHMPRESLVATQFVAISMLLKEKSVILLLDVRMIVNVLLE